MITCTKWFFTSNNLYHIHDFHLPYLLFTPCFRKKKHPLILCSFLKHGVYAIQFSKKVTKKSRAAFWMQAIYIVKSFSNHRFIDHLITKTD